MISNEMLKDKHTAEERECSANGNEEPPAASVVGQMLNYDQAAEFLGVKVTTLYSMVSRGEIPHARIGKRIVRFPRAELEKWVAGHTVPGGSKEVA